jgi:hypothetical protein
MLSTVSSRSPLPLLHCIDEAILLILFFFFLLWLVPFNVMLG